MTKLTRILRIFLVLTAISLVIYISADIAINFRSQKSLLLSQLWRADLNHLHESNQLPSAWLFIKYVDKSAAKSDITANLWLKSLSYPITINPEGNFKLEVLMISQQTEYGIDQALIRHTLVEIESGNTVWEMARTYHLSH